MTTLERVAAGAGAAAARVRSRLAGRPVRPLHPDGRTFVAEVTVWGARGWPWGAAVLDTPGAYRATVRVSRGAGTPTGWPDVLGLAVRVHLAAGPFDLLLSTSGRPVVARHLPLPRRTFTATYGSILSYEIQPYEVGGGRRVLLAALPVPGVTALGTTLDDVVSAAGRPAGRVLLAAATRGGRWRPFGTLGLGPRMPATAEADLAFDPTRRHPADLHPVGLLQAVRGAVYAGAQRARRATPEGPDGTFDTVGRDARTRIV